MMDDYNILISFTLEDDILDALVYSGDFNELYDNEKQYCHHYHLNIVDSNTKRLLPEIQYLIRFDPNKHIVSFYDDWHGDEICFNFKNFEEINDSFDIILSAKIKHFKMLYDVEYSNHVLTRNKLIEIEKRVCKEIDNGKRKHSFFKSNNLKNKDLYIQGSLDAFKNIYEILKGNK